jgi:hypothetical protein
MFGPHMPLAQHMVDVHGGLALRDMITDKLAGYGGEGEADSRRLIPTTGLLESKLAVEIAVPCDTLGTGFWM